MSALFIILVGLTKTLFSDKMLISHRCIRGLMPNLIKKSWTVSIVYVLFFVAHQMSIFEIIVSSDVINVVPKCMYAQYRSYLFENLKCFKIEANVSSNISSIRICCRTVLLAVKKICCVKKACKKVLLPEEIV